MGNLRGLPGGGLFPVLVSASELPGSSGSSLNSRGAPSGPPVWMVLVGRLILSSDLLVELCFE